MFQGLFKRAETTINSVVAKYVGRAMVAIPLLIAGGFATAAATVKLVELYGPVTSYAMMAALFAVIGLVTMAVVAVETRPAEEPVAEQAAEPSADSAETALDPADLLTPEVRAFLSSAAPMALPSVARGIGRNLPLIFILALIGFVISRFGQSSDGLASEGLSTAESPGGTEEAAA